MIKHETDHSRLRGIRMLVAIASYGERNLGLLKDVVAQYQAMPFAVDVVVLSEAPKDLGPGVEVVVGLPSDNPWSLPFAHKAVFANRADRYDLFAYSEDDIGVTARNVEAFLQAAPFMASDEIAGFLRYEVDAAGRWSLPDIHGGYRWRPESARRRGPYTVAQFSNDHAAFYLLTRAQLRAMVEADGFVRAADEGRYDMLCTAATDPYTRYGLRKVICISAIDDFLIHHRSNRYAGQMGVPLETLHDQIEALHDIADGHRPAATLLAAESRWPHSAWAKDLYERPNDALAAMVPPSARSVLSVGCGWGVAEQRLQAPDRKVTVIPIDAVFGAVAARRGLEVVDGSFDECLTQLRQRSFDCVLIHDLLHLLPDPRAILERCSGLVGAGGVLMIGGPNFGSLRVMAKRVLNMGGYRKLRSYDEGGINAVGPGMLKRHLARCGLQVAATRWPHAAPAPRFEARLGRWGASDWLVRAHRRAAPVSFNAPQ